jgi:hypothetical protein
MSNLEASSRKSAATVEVQLSTSARQVVSSPPEKQRSTAPPVSSPSSTVQVRLQTFIPSLNCLTSCAGATRRREKAPRLKTERAHERASAVVDESGVRAAGGVFFRIHFMHGLHMSSCGA